MTVGFLGFGNMAYAIAGGMIKEKEKLDCDVISFDPSFDKAGRLAGVRAVKSAELLAEQSEIIFVCVKPQSIEEALYPISEILSKDKLVVSIAAGVSVEKIKGLIYNRCPVVRVMPNTPLMLGKGTVAIARPDDVDEEKYNLVKAIFSSVGSVYEIEPDKFNEVIPVNASSPAFIYLFAKIISECASSCGIDKTDALNMFCDTMIGSAEMIKNSGIDIDDLIKMVCSKGGTTVAALDAMTESGFEESISNGFTACVERAAELGR